MEWLQLKNRCVKSVFEVKWTTMMESEKLIPVSSHQHYHYVILNLIILIKSSFGNLIRLQMNSI